jgi:hypothetical protein
MRLRYLGKTPESVEGKCEALYITDRGSFAVQGKVITDPEALADVRDLAADETVIEVPGDVLRLVDRV